LKARGFILKFMRYGLLIRNVWFSLADGNKSGEVYASLLRVEQWREDPVSDSMQLGADINIWGGTEYMY
jgi:hypothetical protein